MSTLPLLWMCMEINALDFWVKTKLRAVRVPVQISQELCAAYRCKSHINFVPACRPKSHRNFVLRTGPNFTRTLCLRDGPNLTETLSCVPVQISQVSCAPYRYKSYQNFVLRTGPNLTRTLCCIAVQTFVQVQLHRIHDLEQIRTTYKLQHSHVGCFRYRRKRKYTCDTATDDI